MIVYIDNDFKCHSENDGTMLPVETDFFNSKCQAFIEGFRFVPSGERWIRDDGAVFCGEMIAPWKPYDELEKAQTAYANAQLAIVTADRDKCLADMQELIDEVLGG